MGRQSRLDVSGSISKKDPSNFNAIGICKWRQFSRRLDLQLEQERLEFDNVRQFCDGSKSS